MTYLTIVLPAGLASLGLQGVLLPFQRRYLVEVPNGRSSHPAPTARGGGISVVVGAWLGVALWILWSRTNLRGLSLTGRDHRRRPLADRIRLMCCAAATVTGSVGMVVGALILVIGAACYLLFPNAIHGARTDAVELTKP